MEGGRLQGENPGETSEIPAVGRSEVKGGRRFGPDQPRGALGGGLEVARVGGFRATATAGTVVEGRNRGSRTKLKEGEGSLTNGGAAQRLMEPPRLAPVAQAKQTVQPSV